MKKCNKCETAWNDTSYLFNNLLIFMDCIKTEMNMVSNSLFVFVVVFIL